MEQKSQFYFEIDPETADQVSEASKIITYNPDNTEERILKVRLDKWLWAARFFKTRPLARAAIENGKIFYDGQKSIPSKEVELGATLIINQGRNKKTVVIRGLSTRRRSEDISNALYEETTGIHTHTEYKPIIAEPECCDTLHVHEHKPRKIVRFLRRAMALGDREETIK